METRRLSHLPSQQWQLGRVNGPEFRFNLSCQCWVLVSLTIGKRRESRDPAWLLNAVPPRGPTQGEDNCDSKQSVCHKPAGLSSLTRAANQKDREDPHQSWKSLRAVKQVHGGVGMTWKTQTVNIFIASALACFLVSSGGKGPTAGKRSDCGRNHRSAAFF